MRTIRRGPERHRTVKGRSVAHHPTAEGSTRHLTHHEQGATHEHRAIDRPYRDRLSRHRRSGRPVVRGRTQVGRHPRRRRRRRRAPPQSRRAVGRRHRSARHPDLRRPGAYRRQVRAPPLPRQELGGLRRRHELHLPPRRERPFPRRRADHVRGRRVFARDRQGEPPLRHRDVRRGGPRGHPGPAPPRSSGSRSRTRR